MADVADVHEFTSAVVEGASGRSKEIEVEQLAAMMRSIAMKFPGLPQKQIEGMAQEYMAAGIPAPTAGGPPPPPTGQPTSEPIGGPPMGTPDGPAIGYSDRAIDWAYEAAKNALAPLAQPLNVNERSELRDLNRITGSPIPTQSGGLNQFVNRRKQGSNPGY